MTDQNQPKLTLEEELDVLEAVYKIGKEKGLELLRPEQVKRLEDNGRLASHQLKQEAVKRNNVRVGKKIGEFIDLIIAGMELQVAKKVTLLCEKLDYAPTVAHIKQMCHDMFVFDYGIDEWTLSRDLKERIGIEDGKS